MERRTHRRLDMRLPIEILTTGTEALTPIRATTRNVSPGGTYFEIPPGLVRPGVQIHLALSVPPGDGYSPYGGRVMGTAEILRLDTLGPQMHGHERVGVAARFHQPLKVTF